MKKFQQFFAFGTIALATVLFAGCGAEPAGGGSDAGSGTATEEGEGGGGSGTTSVGPSGDFQLVSLNVPAMT